MPIKMVDVQDWPMSTYPMLSKAGDPFTSFFKMEILKYDGNTDFKTWHYKGKDEDGNTIEANLPYEPNQPRTAALTRVPKEKPLKVSEDDPEWYGMISKIPAEDLIRKEKELGGKPTMVKAGLWFGWENGEWVKDDKEKIQSPRYWLDITERYYVWREEAYADHNDPFKNQKRPYTRIQELEMRLKEAEKKS